MAVFLNKIKKSCANLTILIGILLPVSYLFGQELEFFDYEKNTGNNAVIVIPGSVADSVTYFDLNTGDEIGVFTSDSICAGAVVWTGENTSITVWGDDIITDQKEGMEPGEKLNYKIWQQSTNRLYQVSEVSYSTDLSNNGTYQVNGLYEISSFTAVYHDTIAPILSVNLLPHPSSPDLIRLEITSSEILKANPYVIYSEDTIETKNQNDPKKFLSDLALTENGVIHYKVVAQDTAGNSGIANQTVYWNNGDSEQPFSLSLSGFHLQFDFFQSLYSQLNRVFLVSIDLNKVIAELSEEYITGSFQSIARNQVSAFKIVNFSNQSPPFKINVEPYDSRDNYTVYVIKDGELEPLPVFFDKGERYAVAREAGIFLVSIEDNRQSFVNSDFELYQNYPNPIQGSTKIEYYLPIAERVNITVYNLRGEKVDVLRNQWTEDGHHSVTWNCGNVKSGVYVYRMIVGDSVKVTKKCTVVN